MKLSIPDIGAQAVRDAEVKPKPAPIVPFVDPIQL